MLQEKDERRKVADLLSTTGEGLEDAGRQMQFQTFRVRVAGRAGAQPQV